MNARWLSQTKPEIADKMASLPWAEDGLSETEENIVEQLLYLYVKNSTPTAVSLMDMPFLQSVNPGDLQAVTSLKDDQPGKDRQCLPADHEPPDVRSRNRNHRRLDPGSGNPEKRPEATTGA